MLQSLTKITRKELEALFGTVDELYNALTDSNIVLPPKIHCQWPWLKKILKGKAKVSTKTASDFKSPQIEIINVKFLNHFFKINLVISQKENTNSIFVLKINIPLKN